MKRHLALCLAVAGLSLGLVGIVAGAELTPEYKAPPPATPYDNWSGFYAGVNVGWGWDESHNTIFAPSSGETTFDRFQRQGVIGGGQIGYNWLLNPSWLVGLETDISGTDIHGTDIGCSATGCSSSDGRTDIFGTARGRVGFVQGNWLIYATGGVAYADITDDRTIIIVTHPVDAVLVGQSSSASVWDAGWVAGLGSEWIFAHNWSVKAEWLFSQIDISRTFTYAGPVTNPTAGDRNIDSRLDYNVVRVGVNYHFLP
jgi:outer membrane immunogenic protein